MGAPGRRLVILPVLALLAGCAGTAPVASPPAPACDPIVTFADGRTPTEVRHVAVSGSDVTGTGEPGAPFASIVRAARGASPGTAIRLHSGTYDGGIALSGLRGSADRPIWIEGAPGETRPVISGMNRGNQGIYLTRPRYVVLARLEIAHTADNGLNVDDGDEVANAEAARFVVFRDLDIHDTGRRPSGVAACLKLAGVNDFWVLDSRFARCGNGPESGAVGVNGVGMQRGVIRGNRFLDNGYGGVQFKGGSQDIEIAGNRFENAGWRGVNMGGSTGRQFFRPPLTAAAPHEAARLRVAGNVFIGGETAAAFAGCIDCVFSGNSVINPSRWALRILQEAVAVDGLTFTPTGRGQIANNLFFFQRSALATGEDINVGSGTDSATLSLTGNQWYASDRPRDSAPRLPGFRGPQHDTIGGSRPDFADEAGRDYRVRSGAGAQVTGGCVPQ